MSTVKLSSSLPGGDANGVDPIVRQLIERPDRMQVLICLVDNKATISDNDTGAVMPTIRIRRCEAVLRMDLPTAERMFRRALESRTGSTVLPLELEDDLSAIFAGLEVNVATGEVIDPTEQDDGEADQDGADGS